MPTSLDERRGDFTPRARITAAMILLIISTFLSIVAAILAVAQN